MMSHYLKQADECESDVSNVCHVWEHGIQEVLVPPVKVVPLGDLVEQPGHHVEVAQIPALVGKQLLDHILVFEVSASGLYLPKDE